MAQYKITLIGLENFLNPDRSVFDKMQLPDGIDKETLIGSILMRCQEFELLYSDPDFMTDAVNIWSRKNYWTFDKWIKAINIKYDPLYNYDRTEEWTDTHEGDYSKKGSSNSSGNTSESSDFTRTDNLKQSTDMTRTDNLAHSSDYTRTDDLASTNDTTVTHSEAAFNSSTLTPVSNDVTDQDTSNTGTQRTAGSESNTGTVRDAGTVDNTGTVRDMGSSSGSYGNTNGSSESGDDSFENKHTGRMYGNIGVTTSQQMLKSEIDIARWNMYEHIADLFASEFCIMVY